jgi:hypothetical protein
MSAKVICIPQIVLIQEGGGPDHKRYTVEMASGHKFTVNEQTYQKILEADGRTNLVEIKESF